MTSTQRWYGMVLGVSLIAMMSLGGCQPEERGGSSLTTTEKPDEARLNYAQMPDGSVVMTVNGETRQINLAGSLEWGCLPYNAWIYLEINEQSGALQAPGVNQAPVTLQDITFMFADLPAEVSEVLVARKDRAPGEAPKTWDDPWDTFTTLMNVPVQNGQAAIPVSTADLSQYFGNTHYAVWFKFIGNPPDSGTHFQGKLTLRGTLPDGQPVVIERPTCFGALPGSSATTPATTPFLTTLLTGGGLSLLYEFKIREPLMAFASAWIDAGPPQTAQTTPGGALLASATLTQFSINAPSGTPQTGTYILSLSNNWSAVPTVTCTAPANVTLAITTHATTRTLSCNIPCYEIADISVAFPAGTITLSPLTVANGWCS
jgi:hypothetical protein